MSYQNVKGKLIEPALNPYVASGSAMSVLEQNYDFTIVHTKFINNLLEEVRQSLKIKRTIKLFFVGDYGYGKTTLLNLIAKEFRETTGICIPIKFSEIVTPVAASSHPDKHFESLLGAILTKMYNVLVQEGYLTKQDEGLFKEIELIDLFDVFFKMLERTQKQNILIAFDEVELLFSNLELKLSYFMTFLHGLSEKFSNRPGWGLCISVTQEYYSQIISEARQLQEARFNFKIITPLPLIEVKEYIETKNSAVTLRTTDKIYPFEEEVIDFITVVSGGVPRYVETIGQLLWAEAEPHHTSVSIETARRIFSNTYRVYASPYFSELRDSFNFTEEAEAFLNILFFSGGRRQSVPELLKLKDACSISYFYGLSVEQANSRLKKASTELRNKLGAQYLEVFGQKPYRYTLTSLVFQDIFRSRERI
ncbi:MAG: hypothetical protein RM022_022355 [Nostoc sp. EfeVER01]|uniref:hypothetical protein n=1 Tax=unclassified Nostoc TaxID=2593658 RepID=UPI002AD54C31|nr:hypothetical protein [Nostoc sp. EspVER01]MDZ7995670.1 hypothetical protein [Nostoc sp. EspVER01]